ncbi:TetR/AcrR family transcriptional regulator [Mesobacillus harenae]|uniref:TetR/AcrR family transcriptional regulator n=1 Tax=Mesobacillus harenae TaxID=2213203 RepID=UPI0015813028|nr:TetR/AcrR family transcriptional regulator [Mesobacillus harenae]
MPPIVSEEYKEKKKKEILQSALACFAKKGYEVATIDDIVAQSGISKGAIYNYFKSKDEIYLELMTADTDDTMEVLKNNLLTCKSSLEKIKYLFKEYSSINPFEKVNIDKAIVHYEFRLHSSRDEELVEIMKKRREHIFLELITSIIKEGQESGEFDSSLDRYVYANMFWSIIDGVTIQTVYKSYPYHSVLSELQTMFIGKLLSGKN